MTEAESATGGKGTWMARHPWVALPVFMVSFVVLLTLVGTLFAAAGSEPSGPLQQALAHLLLLFVVTVRLLRTVARSLSSRVLRSAPAMR